MTIGKLFLCNISEIKQTSRTIAMQLRNFRMTMKIPLENFIFYGGIWLNIIHICFDIFVLLMIILAKFGLGNEHGNTFVFHRAIMPKLGLIHSLRELPALIFRNWVHFKQIYVYVLYIIYVIYVKYNYYTYILLKMQQTLSYLRLK